MKRIVCLFITFACCFWAWGQIDSIKLNQLIQQLPEGSEVGISVYDLTAGKSIYAYRASKLSRPASTMKLLTAITALSRPEAGEPFRTEVWYDGVIAHDTLQGNLYVVGGFDPEFDSKAMDGLIEKVKTFPFSVVKGKVLGDVSMKDSLYWGSGWAWDDNPEAFQPYLSPLMFCKGAVEVKASPGNDAGNKAKLVLNPISSYYTVTNQTKTNTLSAGKFSVTRDWLTNGNQLIAQGNVYTYQRGWVNVCDSKSFFIHTFVERLRAKGVEVSSSYDFAELPATGTKQMARWETSMRDVLDQLMKESDNLNAEALLCRLGAQATGKKHIKAKDGIEEIEKLIRQLGHRPDNYKLADGSGLSNYNYISPGLLVDFLKYAYSQTSIFQKLYKALPIAGIDGTLKNRMKKGDAYKNVHAKTGSFTAINSLAGYLKLKNGHDVAFAIMNQNMLSAQKARAFQDRICEIIAGY